MSITVVVHVKVRPEKTDDFRRLALAHAACSRLEPGCLSFQVEASPPACYLLVEQWRDQAAIDAHRQTPHYRRWRRTVVDLEAAPRSHAEYAPLQSKMLDSSALEYLGRAARNAGKAVVWTNGCFDCLHAGHLATLREARAQGDLLIAGLNNDASARALKGPGRPAVGQAERAAVLAALPEVDHVVIFSEELLAEMIGQLQPAVLVKGGEYQGQHVVGAEHAGRVHLARHVEGISTTEILRRAAG